MKLFKNSSPLMSTIGAILCLVWIVLGISLIASCAIEEQKLLIEAKETNEILLRIEERLKK